MDTQLIIGVVALVVLAVVLPDWVAERKRKAKRQLEENKKSIERALAEEAGRASSAASTREVYGRLESKSYRTGDSGPDIYSHTYTAREPYRATPRMTPSDGDNGGGIVAGIAIGQLLSQPDTQSPTEDAPAFKSFGGGSDGGAGASDSWSDTPSDSSSTSSTDSSV